MAHWYPARHLQDSRGATQKGRTSQGRSNKAEAYDHLVAMRWLKVRMVAASVAEGRTKVHFQDSSSRAWPQYFKKMEILTGKFCPNSADSAQISPPQQWQLHWRQGAHPGRGHAPPGAHGTRHPQGGGRAPARRHGAICPAKITKIRTGSESSESDQNENCDAHAYAQAKNVPGAPPGRGSTSRLATPTWGKKICPATF